TATAGRRGAEPFPGPGARPVPAPRGEGRMRRRDYREHRPDDAIVPDTGEPRIVQKARGQFASWAAVSLGCLGINVATGITHPWFLFLIFGIGIVVLLDYSQIWHAGFSWRDVLTRPLVPAAVGSTLVAGE